MSERDSRVVTFSLLKSEVEADLEAINHIVAQSQETAQEVINDTPKFTQKMTLAALIHHFYTGIETILIRIAKELDGRIIEAAGWHQELLSQVTLKIEDVRPPVISEQLARDLDEYRRFRHRFRHAYGFDLDWEKLKPLIASIPETSKRFANEIKKFLKFVDELRSGLRLQ